MRSPSALRALGFCLLTASIGACGNTDRPPVDIDVPVDATGADVLGTDVVGSDAAGLDATGADVPTDGACPSGWSRCADERCYDTRSDPMHCGSCTTACANGQACTASACAAGDGGVTTDLGGGTDAVTTDLGGGTDVVPSDLGGPDGAVACSGSQTNCSGMCRELSTDMDNCGSCGMRCTAPLLCRSGSCQLVCAAGQIVCSGACTDTNNDTNNCGACGMRCGDRETCSAGRCASAGDGGLLPQDSGPCAAGTISCGGYCANTSNDPLNCGGCGMRCLTGQVCTARVCMTGGGTPTDGGGVGTGGDGGLIPQDSGPCAAGTISCGAYCANTSNDPYNCGGCGMRCAATQMCVARVCTTGGGTPSDGGVGTGGDGGVVPQDSGPCATGTVTCGGYCANLTNDPYNCGSCGMRCPTMQMCINRVCMTGNGMGLDAGPCPSGQITCSGYCANGTNDPTNCGTCGHRCADGEICAGGSCFSGSDCGTVGHPCCSSAPACAKGATCVSGICR